MKTSIQARCFHSDLVQYLLFCRGRSVSLKGSCSSWRAHTGAVGNSNEEGAAERKFYKLVAIPYFPAPYTTPPLE